jgi:hypothetical protein
MNINWLGNKKTKIMGELNVFIDNLINERNSLAEQLRNYNAEEKVANVLKENDKLRVNSLHVLSEKEREQADVFRKGHWESCKGNARYILEGTGIGMGVTVQCTKCNRTKNITDVSNW